MLCPTLQFLGILNVQLGMVFIWPQQSKKTLASRDLVESLFILKINVASHRWKVGNGSFFFFFKELHAFLDQSKGAEE